MSKTRDPGGNCHIVFKLAVRASYHDGFVNGDNSHYYDVEAYEQYLTCGSVLHTILSLNDQRCLTTDRDNDEIIANVPIREKA